MGQLNATVGDIAGNVNAMRDFIDRAREHDCDVLVFPEMAVCGYPPEDLLHKKHFLKDCSSALEKLAADCPDKTIIVGFAEDYQGNNYNSAAVLQGGRISKIYRKAQLPNYGVFDERRYFLPGAKPLVINVGGLKVAVTICADIWNS